MIFCLMAGSPRIAFSQSGPASEVPPGGDPWPRKVAAQGATIQIYQPQFDHWAGNTLDAYSAVAIRTPGSSDTAYGVIWFNARTEVGQGWQSASNGLDRMRDSQAARGLGDQRWGNFHSGGWGGGFGGGGWADRGRWVVADLVVSIAEGPVDFAAAAFGVDQPVPAKR